MKNIVTIVTAFFDIDRETRGDGRTIDEYKDWIKKTLQLNCNMFIVTEPKFVDFFKENRPSQYNTYIHVMGFEELYYYQFIDQMKEIAQSLDYKNKIKHPNRVECQLLEYNIVMFSKFHFLEIAISKNIFESNYFMWMDAGCSRFFLDVDLTKPYPSENAVKLLQSQENKLIIQKRYDLETYPIDGNLIWDSVNLLSAGLFGGNSTIITKIGQLVENIFTEHMLKNKNMNNEQIALAMVWKNNSHLFYTTDNMNYHLMLFKLLSI